MDTEDVKEYRWETGYERTWEAITEDNSGLIGESYESFDHKRALVKYQSQSEVIKMFL